MRANGELQPPGEPMDVCESDLLVHIGRGGPPPPGGGVLFDHMGGGGPPPLPRPADASVSTADPVWMGGTVDCGDEGPEAAAGEREGEAQGEVEIEEGGSVRLDHMGGGGPPPSSSSPSSSDA
eukprot:scaffold285590_cov30-Tisochrysis_lutea.AAC.1